MPVVVGIRMPQRPQRTAGRGKLNSLELMEMSILNQRQENNGGSLSVAGKSRKNSTYIQAEHGGFQPKPR